MKKLLSLLRNGLPLIILETIILLTNLIGASFLLWDDNDYFAWSYSFNGMYLPTIMNNEVLTICSLIYLPPLIIAVMYLLGLILGGKIDKLLKIRLFSHYNTDNTKWIYFTQISTMILMFFEIAKIFSVIGLYDILNWTNVAAFYQSRGILFNTLGFWDWVAIYTLAPLGVSTIAFSRSSAWIKCIIITTYILLNIISFQKRPLICGLIIISLAYVIKALRHNSLTKKSIVITFSVMFGIYMCYFVGIYVNTLNIVEIPSKGIVAELDKLDNPSIKTSEVFKLYYSDPKVTNGNAFEVALKRANYGIFNRSAYSGIIYPKIFPNLHNYYLFARNDILNAKDDNIVVGNYLSKDATANVVAPSVFYIMFYAYGGIIYSLVAAAFIGLMLGIMWRCLKDKTDNIFVAMLAVLLMLFSIHISLGSVKDALLSSYGILYPVCLVFLLWMIDCKCKFTKD